MGKGGRARLLLLATLAGGFVPTPAGAIPVFARRYHASCTLCHAGPPRLNAFGEQFLANGYQLARGQVSTDTAETGDPLLHLPSSLPLAIRLDAYAQLESRTREGVPATDFLTPYVMKLLSSGQIARNINYYLYFLLNEGGEVGGVEDAFLQFSDVLGVPKLDLTVGQFQASDPMFKRELRIPFEDYMPYRMRIGNTGADLTYERGLAAAYSPWEGGDVTVELLNGKGLNATNDFGHFSTRGAKNVLGRFSQELGPVRLAGFGYYGTDEAEGQSTRIVMFGPDATLELPFPGGAQLNFQYIRRNDENPFLEASGEVVNTDAAFAELTWTPQGPAGRVIVTALGNWLHSDHRAISLGVGEQLEPVPFLERYRSAALNTSYLLRRNLRLAAEGGYNLDTKRASATVGFVTAF